MISILKNTKSISIGFVATLISFLLAYLCYSARIVSSHIVLNDDFFSVSLNKSISELIDQKISLSGKKLFKELRSDFPMVDQIEVKRTGLNRVSVQVFSADLIWRLGSAFVISNTGKVFLSSAFKASVLRGLPKLHLHTNIESELDVSHSQKEFLLNLPDFVVKDYEVHWYGKNKIILIKDKKQILVRSDQNLDQNIFDRSEKLFDDYQRHANKTCKGTVKADMRFDGRVIISC